MYRAINTVEQSRSDNELEYGFITNPEVEVLFMEIGIYSEKPDPDVLICVSGSGAVSLGTFSVTQDLLVFVKCRCFCRSVK